MATDPPDHVTTEDSGHRWTTLDGHLHSPEDEPAFVYADGTRWWYREGKIHRDAGPAVIWSNGVEEWWRHGQRHRDDGPAVIYPDSEAIVHELRGVRQWWANGKLAREEVPPLVAAYRREHEALRKRHFGA